MEKNTIDESEIKKFTKFSNEWWQSDGSFASLHAINPIRIEYIIDKIKQHFNENDNKQLKILDVGCGGGLASMPLARLGFDVTGIDAGQENIDIAISYAKTRKIDAIFLKETAEEHLNKEIKYDIILCLEIIEHVNNVEVLINALSGLVKKNGIIIISTINKTLKARLFAIGIAEYVLNLLPKNTHNFDKFQKPSQIANYFAPHNLQITEIKGILFDILSKKWILSDNIDVNYICTIILQKL